MKHRREITLKSNVTSNGSRCEIVRELRAREPREVCQPRILVLAIPDVKSRGDEVIVYMALFHLDDKRQKCAPVMARDRTPVVTVVLTQPGFQARFKRWNVHRDTPDVNLHSCVSPLRHLQSHHPALFATSLGPRNRQRRDACLLSQIVNCLSNLFYRDNI
jgi:hypothetical protein